MLGPQNNIVQHPLALRHKNAAAAMEMVRASGSVQSAVELSFECLGQSGADGLYT